MNPQSPIHPPHDSVPPAILLDSLSDIDIMQADAIGVHLLLRATHFDGHLWLDHSELFYDELYRRLDRGAAYPAADILTVSNYQGTLERLLRRAPHVLAVHPSSYGSDSLEIARAAASAFPGKVTVLDSRTISAGMALQAAWLTQQAVQGRPLAQILHDLGQIGGRQRSVVHLNTIKYVKTPVGDSWRKQYGPDASVVVKGPGNNPKLLAVPSSPQRGMRIMELHLRRYALASPGASISIFHTGAPSEAAHVHALALKLGLQVRWIMGPGLLFAAHLGPGACGFSMLPDKVPTL